MYIVYQWRGSVQYSHISYIIYDNSKQLPVKLICKGQYSECVSIQYYSSTPRERLNPALWFHVGNFNNITDLMIAYPEIILD